MSATTYPVVTPSGKGRSAWIMGDLGSIVVPAEATGGAFCVLEYTVYPGSGSPPHLHEREDETFYVLEGEATLMSEGKTFVAKAGDTAYLPKGRLHNFFNATDKPLKMLITLSPAGFEKCLFDELGKPVVISTQRVLPTEAEIQRMIEILPKYGLRLAEAKS